MCGVNCSSASFLCKGLPQHDNGPQFPPPSKRRMREKSKRKKRRKVETSKVLQILALCFDSHRRCTFLEAGQNGQN